MDTSREFSPRGRSMSISPVYRNESPDFTHKSSSGSGSRSPVYRRHRSPNNCHKKRQKGRNRNGDYENERSYRRVYRREHSWEPERSRSRSNSLPRHGRRGHHSRDRDPDRDLRRRSRSSSRWERSPARWDRSPGRWERSPEDRKPRDRSSNRNIDDRDSDCERSPPGAIIGASGSEIIGYKSQPPNNTIMIRGLAQHITENDIRQDIINCGMMPKDIRLIRKKDTGASRGFAFVEFGSLAEAMRWMETKQGVLMLQDQYRAIMQYSIPKDGQSLDKPMSHKSSSDWFCIKCGAQNFKRRDNCFKCHASRTESEEGGSGSDEACSYATKTIMMRNLDALTTEDSILTVLNQVMPDLVKSISAICIGRDPLTSTSRGICYLGTESAIDAIAVYAKLNNVMEPLMIDGKTVILSYCKYNMGDTRKAYSFVGNIDFPNAEVPSTYAMTDVDSLTEYAARRYAKTSEEYVAFYEYYKNYFTQQISQGNSITLHSDHNQMDAANAAAAVAQSAIQQMNATKSFFDSTHMTIPNGTDGKRYPVPDISKYTYDKTTGYQYDSATGLYYDPNSCYYWNSVIQKYLYWDQEKLTYILAPTMYENYSESTSQSTTGSSQESENKKIKFEKGDKTKMAKKIAKDMERWAKTLNQRKDIIGGLRNNSEHLASNSASADIGFAVLEKKNAQLQAQPPVLRDFHEDVQVSSNAAPLVAAYGGESDDSGGEEEDESELLDYNKLICNLCKRQLQSADALTKHAKMSSLHKQNLENRRKSKKEMTKDEKIIYRDRAKERRMKYGDPDEPQPSKLKEKYLKSREITEVPVASASVMEPISSENVGNKLLQKMGWSEGQGLGRLNQGRTTIIQTEQHGSTVGLGNKLPGYTAVAGESYKECVKKMMYARYQELTERENQ